MALPDHLTDPLRRYETVLASGDFVALAAAAEALKETLTTGPYEWFCLEVGDGSGDDQRQAVAKG